MNQPHGGVLVNRIATGAHKEELEAKAKGLFQLTIEDRYGADDVAGDAFGRAGRSRYEGRIAHRAAGGAERGAPSAVCRRRPRRNPGPDHPWLGDRPWVRLSGGSRLAVSKLP